MIGVILAGGAGTRLWPRSRANYPKFLLRFGRQSLLQLAYGRLRRFIPTAKIIVVTNVEHKYLVKEQIVEVDKNFGLSQIICEPVARNTANAVAVAARYLELKFGPDEVMIVTPADHLIKDISRFSRVLQQASGFARMSQRIGLLGLKPSRLATGYGYWRPGKTIQQSQKLAIKEISQFREKPPLAEVKKFLRAKNYYWNSGIFILPLPAIIRAIKKHQPEIARKIFSWNGNPQDLKVFYRALPEVSLDKGVIEKLSVKEMFGVCLDIFWDDVGDWSALERIYRADKNGNVLIGKVKDIDSRGISVLGESRLIATLGLKDIAIVDTPDALLVASKEKLQQVRRVVAGLGPVDEVLYQSNTERPWGNYLILEEGPGYRIKMINVLPGKRLSLQRHRYRREEWLIVAGSARVTLGKKVLTPEPGDLVSIEPLTPHRLENCGRTGLKVLELSRGKILSESDIIRLSDDFQR